MIYGYFAQGATMKGYGYYPLDIHKFKTLSTIEVDYRLAWSRTYLKKFGLLEKSINPLFVK